MSKVKVFIFIFFLGIIIPVVLFLLSSYTSAYKETGLVSPIPEILQKAFYAVTDKNEYWQPSTKTVNTSKVERPEITARAAIAYDLSSDTLLISKNTDKRLPIASLTKIMTAIVAMENTSLNKDVSISNNAATIGENVMGISTGEILTVEDLLYGLFLLSGNDAAEAIAESSAFGRNNFVYQMNKKAEDLGLSNTHFTNPSGLEGDGAQYSTAHDLLVMTRYGLLNSQFARIAATVDHQIPWSPSHKEFVLYNETNLLTSYPGVKGIKTGFTNEAGMCLVTYLEYKEHRIVAVILNSDNRRQEMKDILDYSLKTLGTEPPPHI